MATIPIFAESGDELSTLTIEPTTLQNLYEHRSFFIELYGRARTILRLYVNRRAIPRNQVTVHSLLIKFIKGEEDVINRLDYSILAIALSNHPTSKHPIRIYFQDVIEDHNIRNI